MLSAVPAHTGVPGAAPVRIMPFGDSITQGSAGDHTWRWFLDRHLHATGQEFDFVGPLRSVATLEGWPWETRYADEGFDTDHAGWWGNSMAWPSDPGPAALVTQFRPHVVVLNDSANDVGFWREPTERVLDRLRRWVAAARQADPAVAFVVTEVTIDEDPAYAEFNARLPAFVAELDQEQSPVVLARAADGFVPATGPSGVADTWDAKHPNSSGSQKIAAAVADALADLGVGAPYPRPLPAVDEAPVQRPMLNVSSAEEERVELSWDVVPGATAVQVEHRAVEVGAGRAGEPPWSVLVEELGTREVTELEVAGLAECVRHEFRVRARKGWTLSSLRYASPVVTHRWSRAVHQAPQLRRTSVAGRSTLRWDPVPGECAAEVVVRRSASGSSDVVHRHVVTGRPATVDLADPAPGAGVVVEVTALGVDAQGADVRSATATLGWGVTAPSQQPPEREGASCRPEVRVSPL